MITTGWVRAGAEFAAVSLGIAAGAYLMRVAATWWRYGQTRPRAGYDRHSLTDRFMPRYEVEERHQIRVLAPAEVAFDAAKVLNLNQSATIRAIFKARELILQAPPGSMSLPAALLAQAKALGWGVLAEIPGREIVMGAVTQPWKPEVRFRSVAPAEFARFCEPGYVKIIWTLGAKPLGLSTSLAHTETRVVSTDSTARKRFRRYWSFFSPGIVLIRRIGLLLVKKDAERRYSEARRAAPETVR